jgi:hypothetical protein
MYEYIYDRQGSMSTALLIVQKFKYWHTDTDIPTPIFAQPTPRRVFLESTATTGALLVQKYWLY